MSLSLPIISEAPMNIEEPPGVLDLFGIPYFVLIITGAIIVKTIIPCFIAGCVCV